LLSRRAWSEKAGDIGGEPGPTNPYKKGFSRHVEKTRKSGCRPKAKE